MTNLQKISILCAAALTMGLTACGETAENTDSKESTTAATTTAAAETTTTTTAATDDDSVAETTTTTEASDIIDKNSEDSSDSETESVDNEDKSPILKQVNKHADSIDGPLAYVSEYDEYGNLSSETSYDYNYFKAKQEIFALPSITYDYEYDSKGNITYFCEHNVEKSTHPYRFEYNDKNQKIRKYVCDDNGNISKGWETVFEYDNDLLIKETTFLNDEEVECKQYQYDEKGNCIKDDFYSYKYEYDANNNILKKEYIYKDAISHYETYEYYDNGNISKQYTYYPDDYVMSHMSEYEYDEYNNKTKEQYYLQNKDGEFYFEQTFVYENTYYD